MNQGLRDFTLYGPLERCGTLEVNIINLKWLLKLCSSILLLLLVLYFVDLQELKSTFLSIPVSIAMAVVIGFALSQVISAYKWWLMAKSAGIDVPFPAALKSYFIGMFINCFGLGVVGGDVARGLILVQGKPLKAASMASVIADRVHGLAVLAAIGAMASLFFGTQNINIYLVYFIWLLTFGMILGWFIGPRVSLLFLKRDSRHRKKLMEMWNAFPTDPKTLLYITFISVLFHALQIALHWLMGIGFGVHISWSYLFITIPFVSILTTLPISWNGLGVRENAYVFFFAPLILTAEQAIAFGAMWLLAMTVASVVGGITAFITKDFQFLKRTEAKMPLAEAQGQV